VSYVRAPEVVSADATKDARSTCLDLAAKRALFRGKIWAMFTDGSDGRARATAARLRGGMDRVLVVYVTATQAIDSLDQGEVTFCRNATSTKIARFAEPRSSPSQTISRTVPTLTGRGVQLG